jgi:16S rRNA (guanine966-N2)-methyltransferase
MRIVSGQYRGRRLAAPRGRDVRPTSDKVRESIFNILGPLDGAAVLDMFAGTGAMGIEALSRGAVHATFVEIDRRACDVVQRNLDAIVSDDVATDLIKGDALRVIQTLAMAGEKYDLVIVDPPYDRCAEVIAATADTLGRICHDTTRVVLELSAKHAPLIEQAASDWDLEIVTSRKYGDTSVAILSPRTSA